MLSRRQPYRPVRTESRRARSSLSDSRASCRVAATRAPLRRHAGSPDARSTVPLDQRVEQAALADIRRADERNLIGLRCASVATSICSATSVQLTASAAPVAPSTPLREMNSMSSSTKSRPASSSASSCSKSSRSCWSGRASPPASCASAASSSSCAARIDHAQHGFGLRQIDPPRQKRSQRELARLGQPRARRANGRQHGLQQRRRAERVQLGHRLARVAAIRRPNKQIARHRKLASPCREGQGEGSSMRSAPSQSNTRSTAAIAVELSDSHHPHETHRPTTATASGPLTRTIPRAAPPPAVRDRRRSCHRTIVTHAR